MSKFDNSFNPSPFDDDSVPTPNSNENKGENKEQPEFELGGKLELSSENSNNKKNKGPSSPEEAFLAFLKKLLTGEIMNQGEQEFELPAKVRSLPLLVTMNKADEHYIFTAQSPGLTRSNKEFVLGNLFTWLEERNVMHPIYSKQVWVAKIWEDRFENLFLVEE